MLTRQNRSSWHLALVASAAMVCVAGCAPYWGASLIPVRTERLSMLGYRVDRVDIVKQAEGILVHGSICRTGAMGFEIRYLIVEHLDSEGRLREAVRAPIYGMSRKQPPACGFYSAEPLWVLDREDSIRVRAR